MIRTLDIMLIIMLIVILYQLGENREHIIQLQTDNKTAWNNIRENNKSINYLTEGFFDEYELTKEQLDYIIKKKKWGKRKEKNNGM